MRTQKRTAFFLVCLSLLILPCMAVSAQPAVTFHTAYLQETAVIDSGFLSQLTLKLIQTDGSNSILTADGSDVRINGQRYEDMQQACQLLETAGAIQYATDYNGDIISINFTPLQSHLTNQIYDPSSSSFANPAIPSDLPVYYRMDDDSERPGFTAPFLQSGYTYDLDIYGDGIVITDMRAENGAPFIQSLTAIVTPNFNQTAIDVTVICSDWNQPVAVTVSSQRGFSQTVTVPLGEDTVTIQYPENQEDTLSITASIPDGNSRELTVPLHPSEICTAYVDEMADASVAFDDIAALKLYTPDGTESIAYLTEQTLINGRRYQTVPEMLDALEHAVIIQYIPADSEYLAAVRLDEAEPENLQNIAADEIPPGAVFYRCPGDAPQPFVPPYLHEGYRYNVAVYTYGAIITDMTYPGKPAVIQHIATTVADTFETKTIYVEPLFSENNITYTAVLRDESGELETQTGSGELAFENLPNTTQSYTIALSSEQSDTRQVTVQTTQAEIHTAYLNRYEDRYEASFEQVLATLELYNGSTVEHLKLTENSRINGQLGSHLETDIDTLLQGVVIVEYIKANETTIAAMRFTKNSQPIRYESVGFNQETNWFSNAAIPQNLPVLHIQSTDNPAMAVSKTPYLHPDYTYRLEVYPQAVVIRNMTYSKGSNTIQEFHAAAVPGLYQQSIEGWAQFSQPVTNYTVELLDGETSLHQQTIPADEIAVFENLPPQAHSYTVRFYADGSDTREITVETAEFTRKRATLSSIVETITEQGTPQLAAAVMEDGIIHTYPFSASATLPDGSLAAEEKTARLRTAPQAVKANFRPAVLFSLNDEQQISRMRYAQPIVITDVQADAGQLQISYVMTLLNADTDAQTSVTPCAAFYCNDRLIAVHTYNTLPLGEEKIISDTITIAADALSPDQITCKALWLDTFTSLRPLQMHNR